MAEERDVLRSERYRGAAREDVLKVFLAGQVGITRKMAGGVAFGVVLEGEVGTSGWFVKLESGGDGGIESDEVFLLSRGLRLRTIERHGMVHLTLTCTELGETRLLVRLVPSARCRNRRGARAFNELQLLRPRPFTFTGRAHHIKVTSSRRTTMASLTTRSLLRQRLLQRSQWICPQCRHYADSPVPAPPLLLKLRRDLKTAMKEKDTNRLNVLRALLGDVTSSAKTQNSVKTDMQLLSMLRKRASAAKAASDEFKAAGRQDLVDREEGQVKVLDEYAGDVETMSQDEIRDVVIQAVDEAKAKEGSKVNMGEILKKLLGPGGTLDGKPVEKKEVAPIVKEVLSMS